MSYETYPKKGSHPSKRFGECHTTDWPENTKTEYPAGGVRATDYDGDKSKTLSLGGGSGGKNKPDYPKKKRSFGTVNYQGKS